MSTNTEDNKNIRKVHCLFEQSGTFKKEFIKLGYDAEDYDIQNNFGETNHVIDLFKEIEKGYCKERESSGNSITSSIFDNDNMTKDDLIMAFFPCIYFETIQMLYYSLDSLNNQHKPKYERIADAIERIEKRTEYHILLYKLVYIAEKRGLRLIIENPATKPHYLIATQNFPPPTIIDNNRMLRGDHFKKPTAYWFFNITPTNGFTHQPDKKQKIVNDARGGIHAGVCSEERSMMSPDYARNFICDFILGKSQDVTVSKRLF